MTSTETHKMVLAAAAACEDKKAEETRVLELDRTDSGFTDFFLITSGANSRQVVAISDEIELRLKREFGVYPNSVEGRRLGEWVLMDYVDFVVHIFEAERRAYYDIERLRKSATRIDVEQWKAALDEKLKAARRKSVTKKTTTPKQALEKPAGAKKKLGAAKKASAAKKATVKPAKKSRK
jgi:ribosome-associated protein